MFEVDIHLPNGKDHRYKSDHIELTIPSQPNIRLHMKNDKILILDDRQGEPVQVLATIR